MAESPLSRARRAAEAQSLADAIKADLTIWAFCTWCGHANLLPPERLSADAKDAGAMLADLERRLRCTGCRRLGVRLIPTDRTMVSFDRMTR